MTDLFDSLSTRFAPSASVAIRPRPQSRFETHDDTAGVVEEQNFDIVSAPEPAKTPAAPRRSDHSIDITRDTTSIQKPATPDIPTHKIITVTHPTMPPDEGKIQTPQSPAQTQDTETSDQPIATPPMERHEQRPTHQEPLPQKQSEPPSAVQEIHQQTAPEKGGPETPTPPPIQTRIAPPQDKPSQSTPAPRTKEPSTIVRIGRVEIRQPAPPPSAPKPPTPRHATNGMGASARSAGLGNGRAGGSGLTDYLGWKRR